MILLDSNLLFYAYMTSMAEHRAARDWLEGVMNGSGRVGLPWIILVSFMRLAANQRMFTKPAPPAESAGGTS